MHVQIWCRTFSHLQMLGKVLTTPRKLWSILSASWLEVSSFLCFTDTQIGHSCLTVQFPFHFLHIHQSTSQVNLVPVIAWQLSGKAGYYQCQERLVLDARTPVSRAKFDYSTHHLHILSLFFLVFKVASNFENVLLCRHLLYALLT